jgi:hypothetical protein
MAGVEIETVLDGTPEFVADAVVHLAACLGEEHPTVLAGRRIMASLEDIPNGAVLVTEETLAAAIRRAWPISRANQSRLTLSAATIIAALRAGPR